jgi:hypothetical protein
MEHKEDNEGGIQYKVRFVGYGPKDDLWFDDDELLHSAPKLVAEYHKLTDRPQHARK